MKKLIIFFVFWWAIVFPSLNFNDENLSSNIEFRFLFVDSITQIFEKPTSLHFPS